MRQREEWELDLRRAITSVAELRRVVKLSRDEEEAAHALRREYPLKVTRHYLNLIDPGDPNDPLRKVVIPSTRELIRYPGEDEDDVHADEATYQPVPGIIHRYHGKLLLLPTLGCPSHCRFCFRKGHKIKHLTQKESEAALNYIRNDTSIRDVIITGGDPLILTDDELYFWVSSIRAIKHVEIIRVTTRAPIYLPSRVTKTLVGILAEHQPIYVILSFLHYREITPEIEDSIRAMADAGLVLLQQGPILRGVNDDPATLMRLYEHLSRLRVLPYYAIWGIHSPGTEHFTIDGQSASGIIASLENETSGFCVPHLITIARGDKVRMMGWSPEKAKGHELSRPRRSGTRTSAQAPPPEAQHS